MKIGNNSYNFGRCLKVSFSNINATTNGKEITVFDIEHAPEVDRDKFVAMDVVVTDRPSARAKDNPGFQATVTIYNPARILLDIINGGATWVNSYISEKDSAIKRTNNIKRYYDSRLQCTISAGYVNDNGVPEYNQIIKGYVMGSSLSRKGVEEVLTFGVFDIDLEHDSLVLEEAVTTKSIADKILEAQNTNKFADTWYDTLVKYIKKWETMRIDDPKSDYETRRKVAYAVLNPKNQEITPLSEDKSRTTYEDRPMIPVSDFDRNRSDWFEIKFVTSVADWLFYSKHGGRDWTGKAINVKLQEALMGYKMPTNNAVYGTNLAQMLDGLCAVVGRIGWYRDIKNRTRNTYLIYELGDRPLWVQGEKAEIKIWNYQNLLESPSVSGSGIMTVKMIFNPECVCNLRLALMLETEVVVGTDTNGRPIVKKLASDDGIIRDITPLESGLIGSMSTTSEIANYGNIQISGSNPVAATNKKVQDAKSRGYLFNIGFPIISVKHELSTYGKNWTTTVQTVPTVAGQKLVKQKDL